MSSTTDRHALLDEYTERVAQIVITAWRLKLQLGLGVPNSLKDDTEPNWDAINAQFAKLRECRQWFIEHPNATDVFRGQRPGCITVAGAKFASWHHAAVASFADDAGSNPLKLHLGTSADDTGKHTFDPAGLDWRLPDLGLSDASGLDCSRDHACARIRYLSDADSNPVADLGISPRTLVLHWSGLGWAQLAAVSTSEHLPELDAERDLAKERSKNSGQSPSVPVSPDDLSPALDFGDWYKITGWGRSKLSAGLNSGEIRGKKFGKLWRIALAELTPDQRAEALKIEAERMEKRKNKSNKSSG